MRIKVPLFGYAAASIAGALSYLLALTVIDDFNFSFFFFFMTIGLVLGAIIGAIVCLPVSLPVIILTEYLEQGPWWLFLIAGFVAWLFMILALAPSLQAQQLTHSLPLLIPTLAGSMTYWYMAWKRNAPEPDVAPDLEVFE